MKVGVLTTVHIRHPASLGTLRVLVDSVRTKITGHDEFLIVDDSSPECGLKERYYRWLESNSIASVFTIGEPAKHLWDDGEPGERRSFGHAGGLMAGFHHLREMECDYAWIIDGDCAVLEPIDVSEPLRLFQYDKVAVVTDYYCGRPANGDQIVSADTYELMRPDGSSEVSDKSLMPCVSAFARYGFPTLFCALVDLSVETRFGNLRNAGWVNAEWGQLLFRTGYRVAYYPFFQERKVFHLGHGYSKFNAKKRAGNPNFGNTTELRGYGGKDQGFFHAGFLQLNRSLEEHIEWLRSAADTDFDTAVEHDPAWFNEPSINNLQESSFLRRFKEDDLDALCTFDSDAESVRFMQWGPHDRDKTAQFLTKAITEPHRWYALSAPSGELLGFGELRPEPDGVGLIYVILPGHRRKELGAKLLETLVQAAYYAGHLYAFVRIDVDNEASIRTFEKLRSYDRWELHEEPYSLRGAERSRRVYKLFLNPARIPDLTPEEHAARRIESLKSLGIL